MKRAVLYLTVVIMILGMPLQTKAVELNVGGKSALLMDVATGTILYESNAHERLAPASVTKVMTMLLIMEAVDSGKIRMDDMVTASEAAAAKGGSQIYLKVGESMPVSDMLKSIAVSSANDCACAMAEHLAGSESAFVSLMNQRAAELGMEDTHFVNCTGLDDGEEAKEHRTSAHDIALMSRELLGKHPDIRKFTTIWMDTVRNGAFGLSNTNKLIRFYDGATGLKTGFTSGAGYCLSASAEREGMELIAVVMGCETSNIRMAACKSMLDYGFANYALAKAELPEPQTVKVTLGKQTSVEAKLESDGAMLIDKGQKNNLSTRVQLEEEVEAPVQKGQKLGQMTVLAGDQVLSTVPLVAAENVDKKSFGDLFAEIMRKTCGGK